MKKTILYLTIFSLSVIQLPVSAYSQEFKNQKTGLYNDVFEQNLFYEISQPLRLNRMYRLLFNKKVRAQNVNIYDEVPDSNFFNNRHSKKSLTHDELMRGVSVNEGPQGKLEIFKGKGTGLHPGFFVNDARGDKYLLKFDDYDHLELTTSSEVVVSRFYHAIGYNVPQYTVHSFAHEDIAVGEAATIVDRTGFKKTFTPDKLEEYLLFIPRDNDGNYRASASKFVDGDLKGSWSFLDRRKEDSADNILHQDRREVRALVVFSAWLNNFDVRESNTLDAVVEENGQKVLKHYVIDFSAALGSAAGGAKPPMFTHENMFDFGETFKSFISLGLREKDWEKRFEENGEDERSPAVGYFDNLYFHPENFATQLPHYAFKNLSRADGFWAAKIINSFSDDDVRSLVKAGRYSDPEDEKYISQTLIERRDIIVRYWLGQSSALDHFVYANGSLSFEDLAVKKSYEKAESTTYQIDVVRVRGSKKEKVNSFSSQASLVSIEKDWFANADQIDLFIRTSRGDKESPYVLVSLSNDSILGIRHQD
jgi:hypothetical protein